MKIITIAIAFLIASTLYAADVKKADLAGAWYPLSGPELKELLRSSLDLANPVKVDGPIFAIITPHAGYKVSATVAAYSYKLVVNKNIKTVIILGFSHRKPFDGISVYDKGSFMTPLGPVSVDTAFAAALEAQNNRIYFNPEAFDDENSIEMQIPFIQFVFPDARIVPIAFGTGDYNDAEVMANALAEVLRGKTDCLIVTSTDLSHYHPYDEANTIDRHMITTLMSMNGKALYDDVTLGISEACGMMPIVTTLLAAEKLGFEDLEILKYANSGDTYGDKSQVVGYLSAVIYKNLNPGTKGQKAEEGARMLLNGSQRKRLLEIARESITSFVKDGKRKSFIEKDPVLNEPMGAFVTLHENGELRGCIGNMIAEGPLYQTVADMAVEAATGDPRFPRLSQNEIEKIDLEISALSPLKRISDPAEIKIPGHGVLVRSGFRSGVYLPQVATEAGWNKEEFMTSLCAHKAGLAPDAWKDPATEIYIFSAEVFGEKKEPR